MPILLDVWREACRHIDIGEATDRIAQIAGAELDADFLIVRRWDAERARLETIAVGACRPKTGASEPATARSELSAEQRAEINAWFGRRVAESVVLDGASDFFRAIVPADLPAGGAIIAPLHEKDAALGVLIAWRGKAGAFGAADIALVASLLEPFAVALHNDARLHELARLREALEADKQALLTRLDRQSIAESIVGSDSGLKRVMERVEQVAHTDVPVLIFGETGTGKEVIARAIHERSRRAAAPIVRVNCGALPPGLVDSELFGHERGSFTGAVATRQGWFERADGGTLFLDEIGELPLEAQVRLLRILQDGTFERVGGHRTHTVDVRIVAATHRDLFAMVGEGRFREDLWYRIGVFPIRLPPLRERREDIPHLATHFAERAGRRLGGTPLTPSSDDLEMLTAYSWPGNVRELASVIERAAILGDGHQLDIAGALGVVERRAGAPGGRSSGQGVVIGELPTLAAAMRSHIEEALRRADGRVEGARGAAALLHINPHTLRARMRKLGIAWGKFRQHEG